MPSTSDPPGQTLSGLTAELLRSPAAPPGHFDELRDANGQLRDAWRRFAELSAEFDAPALGHASHRIARQMHEHGVTYNVYESPSAPAQTWALDVLPFIVTSDDWAAVERGARQQARLFDAIARDLYGPRQLVTERLIAPEAVFGQRGFVRGAVGVHPPGGTFIHVAAVDVARSADGRWRSLGVRLQAPSGLGYALENRATMARIFPDALRELGVRSLSPCADQLLAALMTHAPAEDGQPRAVLLTPGPYTESYFEHLYLARELGLTLVQGGDLTVRQDRVFLKTVLGLRPVHAIWRRVDDDFCDPLELRSDSTLGVAGLLQAWRAGGVLVANAFGLGVLESPAILSRLPDLARRLLDEPLHLDVGVSVPHADRPDAAPPAALPSREEPPDRRRHETSRASWMNRLTASQTSYATDEVAAVSHAPVWSRHALESRGVAMRVFLVTDGQGDYRVLPCALTRVANGQQLTVSAHRGGASKDTWILADGITAAPAPAPPVRGRTRAERRTVTSRAAEHLFWMGRYAERSENAARLTRTILVRLTEAGIAPAPLMACMIRRASDEGLLTTSEQDRALSDAGLSTHAVVTAVASSVFDRATRLGLAYGVDNTTRVAGSIRERLSSDNWRLLARLGRRLAPRPRHPVEVDQALEAVDDAILSLVAAGGLEMAHMTRDDGWRFLSLGRHIERLTFMSATLLAVAASNATDEPSVLDWVLDVSDSGITYRARYHRVPEWPAVTDLLLFDGRNPRAALFQVSKLLNHLRGLPGAMPPDLAADIEELARAERASTEEDDIGDHVPALSAGEADRLLALCHDVATRASDAITLQYFSHVYDLQHSTMNA